MATKEQIEQWRQDGKDVARARKDRDNHGDRPPEEVKRLREAAAETAAVCADCFMPLASTTSVTLTIRWTHHTPMRYNPIGMRVPARDHRRDVPICLPCWLTNLTEPSPLLHDFPGLRQRGRDHKYIDDWDEVRRHRCEGCGRAMRVVTRRFRRLPLRERCCCAQCLYKATLRHANERRRVKHHAIACEACGAMFVPTQSTAKTCSNRCRQKLHRQRHRAPTTKPRKRSRRRGSTRRLAQGRDLAKEARGLK